VIVFGHRAPVGDTFTFREFSKRQNEILGSAVAWGAFLDHEADLPFVWLRRRHELANRVENDLKLCVVLVIPKPVPVVQLACPESYRRVQALRSVQVVYRIQEEPDKSAHDFYIHLNRAFAVQNRR
jgi:hypothetical protein